MLGDVTLDIANGAVTTAKLADDAVTAAKINPDVAGTGLTQDGTTGALEVDVSSITGDGDITSTDLAVGGDTNALLGNVTLDIANGAVTTVKLADDAVTAAKIDVSVAGTGLTQNGTTGALEVDVSGLAGLVTSVNGETGAVSLRTVDGESLTSAGGDISVGVTLVTGDGVDNTNPGTPAIRFPLANEVDDAAAGNKFATQAQLDQIATNTSGIATNVTNIATNSSAIAANVTNIAANTAATAANAANIATNAANIATNVADLAGKEPAFAKNTAFNKDFGTAAGEVPDAGDVVFRPPPPSFEGDLLAETGTPGTFQYVTPNGGSVKFVGIAIGQAFSDNDTQLIQLSNPVAAAEVFSSATVFPKNVSNQFPGQDPVANRATFLPFIYNTVAGTWVENTVVGQTSLWRIQIRYTRTGNQNNREIVLRIRNPDPLSSFELEEARILPGGPPFNDFSYTFQFQTVADALSLPPPAGTGVGYELELQTIQAGLTIDEVQIVRTSLLQL